MTGTFKRRLVLSVSLLAAALGLAVYYYMASRSDPGFRVVSLNSGQKAAADVESYFYADPDSGQIYRYDLRTRETETVYPGKEASDEDLLRPYLEDFAVCEDWIYFVRGKGLYQYNCRTGEEAALKQSEGTFSIDISGQYLFYYDRVSASETDNDYTEPSPLYLCPLKGDIEKDSVNIEEVFVREAKQDSGVQVISYEGFDIMGEVVTYGDVARGYLYDIREHDSGNRILGEMYSDRTFIMDDGTRIRFSLFHTPCYEYEDVPGKEKQEIACLQDAADWQEYYRYTFFDEKYMMQEGDGIVCLLQVTDSPTGEPVWQRYSIKDILFRLNPETGESSILYETESNKTRIIGYQDGTVYLLRDFRVYARSVNDGEEEKLFSLPGNREIYYFDWYQDYLIVTDLYRKNEVIVAYKIK